MTAGIPGGHVYSRVPDDACIVEVIYIQIKVFLV